jgi:hypothetical protein
VKVVYLEEKEMVRVAVIDNGICEKYIKGNITHYKIERNTVVKDMEHHTDQLTHGTICAYIISYIMEQVEIIDINAFDARYGSVDDVILALEWCRNNSVSVINMSFGTVNFWEYSKMEYVIKKLSLENRYLVSAFHNFNIKSYPAAFEKVFGVRTDKGNTLKNGDYTFLANQGLNKENTLVAHWDLQEWLGDLYKDKFPYRSSSFSVPVITAYIARCLKENPEEKFEGVLKYLEQNSVRKFCDADEINKVYTKLKLSIEIPVIAFMSEDSESAIKLKQLFEQEGYEVAFVTEGEQGEESIPLYLYCDAVEVLTHEIVASIVHIYKSDILIFCLHENRFNTLKKGTIDIVVRLEADTYRIEYSHLSQCCNTIMEIYEGIQNLFV